MSRISVTTCASDFAEQWEDLTRRGRVNVFMHPAALNAVRATGFANLRTLFAWDEGVVPHRLVGVWALQQKNFASFLPPFLAGPAYDYAVLSCPVIDTALEGEVIEAFFDTIQNEAKLPKVIRLDSLDGGGGSYLAMLKALGRNGRKGLTLAERGRPFAVKGAAAKRSGSTRKKLRQNWNRLSALGGIEILNERTPSRVQEAFETFLAMEAASWKGTRGTALLSKSKDAVFARRLIGDMARAGSASVALMTLSGKPLASLVLLYCGATAFTWKTAFDAEFARYSPGALLVDRLTDQLFSGGTIESIEACSPEGGLMAQLWPGRRSTVDLLVELKATPSLNFILAAFADGARRRVKRLRNAVRIVHTFQKLKTAIAHDGRLG